MMLESQLASLLEGTADAAFTVDAQGEIRTWNKAAEKLFGYPSSFAIGKPCAALVNGWARGIGMRVCRGSCDILECARVGREISNFDMEVRTREKQRVWVNVSMLVAVDERTQRRLIIHFMRDIHARKEGEKLTGEVLRLAKRLVRSEDETTSGLPPIAPLTQQEKAILGLLAAGKTTKELTGQLQISASTLRNHMTHINKKLHTKSRIEAVMQALKRGLI